MLDDKLHNVYMLIHVGDFHHDEFDRNQRDTTKKIHDDTENTSYDHNHQIFRSVKHILDIYENFERSNDALLHDQDSVERRI